MVLNESEVEYGTSIWPKGFLFVELLTSVYHNVALTEVNPSPRGNTIRPAILPQYICVTTDQPTSRLCLTSQYLCFTYECADKY